MTDTLDGSSPDNPDNSISRARPVVLLLIDGWGVAPAGEGNAMSLAHAPMISSLIKEYPVVTLEAAVGDWNKRYLSLGAGVLVSDEEQAPLSTLSGVISQAGWRQTKITDADRFAALTYFFNGLDEHKMPGEDWQIISTRPGKEDKITANFRAVLKAGVRAIKENEPADFIVISLSYLDAVALAAADKIDVVLKAVEAMDKGVRLLVQTTLGQGGVLLISSAGGNVEQLINIRTEAIDYGLTDHSVPLIIVGEDYKGLAISGQDAPDYDLSILQAAGTLADVSPTILALLGLEKPQGMSGRNLLG